MTSVLSLLRFFHILTQFGLGSVEFLHDRSHASKYYDNYHYNYHFYYHHFYYDDDYDDDFYYFYCYYLSWLCKNILELVREALSLCLMPSLSKALRTRRLHQARFRSVITDQKPDTINILRTKRMSSAGYGKVLRARARKMQREAEIKHASGMSFTHPPFLSHLG